MNMIESARRVTDRESLVEFVREMRDDLNSGEGSWENPTLERFLDALAAWCSDSSSAEVVTPSWTLVAEMLGAASLYE
jgi:hypothetical protein